MHVAVSSIEQPGTSTMMSDLREVGDDANYSDTTIEVEGADSSAPETQVLVIPQADRNDTKSVRRQ